MGIVTDVKPVIFTLNISAVSSKRLKDSFKVNVIQGLIARKDLKAKGFFGNLRMHLKKKKKNAIT